MPAPTTSTPARRAAPTGATGPGLGVDTRCSARGSSVGLRIDGGKAVANGASASLTFTSPAGTAITDFALDSSFDFRSNPALPGTWPLYALYQLGTLPFAGAGDYHNATRKRLKAVNAWYGYPAGNATIPRRTVTLRQFGANAGYRGDATALSIRVGCFSRPTGMSCSAPAGARVQHRLYGMDVTVDDREAPVPTVSAEGLLGGGPRSGSDPVVLTATDNAGVRRVELYDVTDAAAPQVVGSEDYTAAKTDLGATCSARLAKTCPDLARETVRPTALRAGRRLLLVRTIDAGANPTDRGPYTTFADTTTRKGGRFRVAYRFRDAHSRGREFRFRAKLRAGKRYPFATGYSRRVTVRVR